LKVIFLLESFVLCDLNGYFCVNYLLQVAKIIVNQLKRL
jgi:hypothetical protein